MSRFPFFPDFDDEDVCERSPDAPWPAEWPAEAEKLHRVLDDVVTNLDHLVPRDLAAYYVGWVRKITPTRAVDVRVSDGELLAYLSISGRAFEGGPYSYYELSQLLIGTVSEEELK